MSMLRPILLIPSVLASFVLALPLLARAETEPGFIYGQNYSSANPAGLHSTGPEVTASHNWSGAFTYQVPLHLPAGRSGLQPQLTLGYNSQSHDPQSWVGAGWSLSLPVIQRVNKTGVSDLYDQTYFTSSLDGELVPVTLTDSQHGTYAAKINTGNFLRYEYTDDNRWSVTDKSGVLYLFGTDDNALLNNPDDTTQTFAWYETEAWDLDSNSITYAYTKDQNQVYPLRITYTDHSPASAGFAVDFALGSRDDQLIRFDAGFEVRTYYVIESITVSANDQWVQRYDLNYSKPAGRERYLLSSIIETGRATDGTETVRPATTFTYQETTGGWELDSRYTLPTDFTQVYGGGGAPKDTGARMFDVNGDGLADMVYAVDTASGPGGVVWLNTGSGFVQDTGYTFPVGFLSYNSQGGQDLGVRIADVNGDGYQDLIKSSSGANPGYTVSANGVFLNDPVSKTWVRASYTFPIDFIVYANGMPWDTGARLVDVNGDGLPDAVLAVESNRGIYDGTDVVYINTGAGWVEDPDYSIPIAFARQFFSSAAWDVGVSFSDVNGDGLTDILQGTYEGNTGAFINQGLDKTWVEEPSYGFNSNILDAAGAGPYDSGMRIFDADGDQLTDLLWAATGYDGVYSDSYAVELSVGDTTGWTPGNSGEFYIPVGLIQQTQDRMYRNMDDGVRFADVNGDGLTDIVKSNSGDTDNGVYINQAQTVDTLIGVTTASGGTVSVSYAANDHTLNPNLPYPVQVVSEVVSDDGLGHAATTTYTYSGGENFFEDNTNKRFAGFAEITETTDDRTLIYFYHQGNESDTAVGEVDDSEYKIGKAYRMEVADPNGNPLSTTITSWQEAGGFVYPSQQITLQFSTDGTHVDTATSSTYNTANGNVEQRTTYGEVVAADDGSFVDTGTDLTYQIWTYATDPNGQITNAVADHSVHDSGDSLLQESVYTYDHAPFGEVVRGHVTIQQDWIIDTTYATTEYTYTDYGLVATATDDNNHTTTTIYDEFGLHPATTTNALGQETSASYDPGSGQVASLTDPNGATTSFAYDGLVRLLTKQVSDPANSTLSVTVETHTYDDTSLPRTEVVTRAVDASTQTTQYIYRDGWGRAVQTRTSTEDPAVFTVLDSSYNAAGLLETQSLPYFGTGSSYAGLTTDSTLLLTTTYDALRRQLSTTTNLGTTSLNYSGRTITITDPLGHQSTYTYDAADQLIQVVEDVGSVNATTTYTRDSLERIIQQSDPSQNLVTSTYDGLSRVLTRTLPYLSGASDMNQWTYVYDGVGNVTQTTTPNNLVSTTSYDAVNRPLLQHHQQDTTLVYDTCTNGIGHLCQATVGSAVSSSYAYDLHGNRTTEARTISGTTYTAGYAYTWNNQLNTLTYPDNSNTTYTWNNGGQVETATFTPTSGAASQVVTDVDYAPNGQVSSISYLNGATTTYTFDPAKLYAPTAQSTTRNTSNVLGLTFDYDANLNMTSRILTSPSVSDSTAVYGYDHLNRLTGGVLTVEGSALPTALSYTYDANGNMTSNSQLGSYTYSTEHPQAVTRVPGKNFTYDDAGNATAMNSWAYTWNDQGQMTKATLGTKWYDFQYDETGARLSKYSSALGTTTVSPNQYYDVTSLQNLRYIQIPGLGTAVLATLNRPNNVASFMYHVLDYQGSHLMSLNSNGVVKQSLDYYPFGQERVNTKNGFTDFYTFTGETYDSETGLMYMGARYYSPVVGRFMSQDLWSGDPLRPQTLNKYSYGLNNPLRYTDPSGAVTMDTLKTGISQMVTGVYQIFGGMFVKAMSVGKVGPVQGTINIAGAFADFDDGLVNFTNGFNNIVNAVQNGDTETILTQGPYRDLADHVPGMNQVLDAGQIGSEYTRTNPTNVMDVVKIETGVINGSVGVASGQDIVERNIPGIVNFAVDALTPQPTTYTPPSYQSVETTLSAPDQSSWYTRTQNYINKHSK